MWKKINYSTHIFNMIEVHQVGFLKIRSCAISLHIVSVALLGIAIRPIDMSTYITVRSTFYYSSQNKVVTAKLIALFTCSYIFKKSCPFHYHYVYGWRMRTQDITMCHQVCRWPDYREGSENSLQHILANINDTAKVFHIWHKHRC